MSHQRKEERRRTQKNRTHVELLSRERTRSNPRRIRLDNPNHLSNRPGWQAESRANSSDSGRRTRDEGVRSKIEVEHESVRAFDEDALLLEQSAVEEGGAVDDEGLEASRELLVALDLAFGVISGRDAKRKRVSFLRPFRRRTLIDRKEKQPLTRNARNA